KSVPLSDILVAETIFSDASKGLKVPEKDLEEAFGTVDTREIAEIVLRRGTLQLTAEQRKRMVEETRRKIIALISRQSVDPRTKLPHPPTRVEQALEQIRFPVDPFRSVEEQANEAIKLLRPILPISIEKLSVSVHIPPQYAGRAYGTVKSFGTITSESWRADGSWSAVVEMPAGMYGPFLEKVGQVTRGNVEAQVAK
ncbi:MAG: ribosome assembly factor SBDS, partial [Candidatus Bathyarchaeota archaeon]|nr:ribosome assembly factor SBDS [Candidatus Bathyarchaeota archaeon]